LVGNRRPVSAPQQDAGLQRRRPLVSNVPWFLPGVALSLVGALVIAPTAGRVLGVSRIIAGLLVLSVGVILAATITPIGPQPEMPTSGAPSCDLTNMAIVSVAELLTVNDRSLNVALFAPLGATIGLHPGSRRRWTILAAGVCLPFGIEALQLLAPVLARGCESVDVIDNLTGLALGLGVGSAVRSLR
jgi:hypothetical protein